MPPKRKSSLARSHSRDLFNKRNKSLAPESLTYESHRLSPSLAPYVQGISTPSSPTYGPHTPALLTGEDSKVRTTTGADGNVKTIANVMYFRHGRELKLRDDACEDVEGTIEIIIGWYLNTTLKDVQSSPNMLFEGLRDIEATFTLLLSSGPDEFKASIPPTTLQTYVKVCKDFGTLWRTPIGDIIQSRFQYLRDAVGSRLVTRMFEYDFHEFAANLTTLTPDAPAGVDDEEWTDYVPMLVDTHESLAAWENLRNVYHEFQHKTYNRREDTKLWLLIWRSLKLMYAASCEMKNNFPKPVNNTTSRIETEFFQDAEIRLRFQTAMREVGYLAADRVECLTGDYCGRVRNAHDSHHDKYHAYRAVSISELSSEEEEAFRACLAQRDVSPKLLHLVHRAALRLTSIKSNTTEGLLWCRTKLNFTTSWPDASPADETPALDQALQDTNEELFTDLKGHDRKCAFDYVYFPFPETRALEVAASEQISREMSKPGIVSDGARVQYVVNVPPWHTRPPASVSGWSKFRLRGPVGFTIRLLQAFWSWKSPRRPSAKPRASLTSRSSKKKSISQLSPAKDQSRRVNKSQAWKSVPKLRGGGKKPASGASDKPGSPKRSSISPISDHRPSDEDDQPDDASAKNSSPTPLEKDERLRAFKLQTRNEGKPFNNEKYIRDFLEPSDWDVETAVDAYIQSVADRRRERAVENLHRRNSITPTPKQRTPPPLTYYDPDPDPSLRAGRPESRIGEGQAIRDTEARPGIYDVHHDDSGSSSSSEGNSDSSDISSRFEDPSLLKTNKENVTLSSAGSNKENQPLDPKDEDEDEENDQANPTEDFSDGGDTVTDEDADDGETHSDSDNADSGKENGLRPLSTAEMFDVFEDDVPAIEGGHLPSSSNHNIFGRRSDVENDRSDPTLPSLGGQQRQPLGLLRMTTAGASPQRTDTPSRLPSPDIDSQPEDADATHDEESAHSQQARAERVARQPLQTLEENSISPTSTRTPPEVPFEQRQCHPCPDYAGKVHHFCHCYDQVVIARDQGHRPHNMPRMNNTPGSGHRLAQGSYSDATQDLRAGIFLPRERSPSPAPSLRTPNADGTIHPFPYDRGDMYTYAVALRESIRALIPVFLDADNRMQTLPRNEMIHTAMRLYNATTWVICDYFDDMLEVTKDMVSCPRWNTFQAVLPQQSPQMVEDLQRLFYEADTIRHYFRPREEIFNRPGRPSVVASLQRATRVFAAVKDLLYYQDDRPVRDEDEDEERAAMGVYYKEPELRKIGFYNRGNRSPPPVSTRRFVPSSPHLRHGQLSQLQTVRSDEDGDQSAPEIKKERSSSDKQPPTHTSRHRSRSRGVTKAPPRQATIKSTPISTRRTSPGQPQTPPRDYKHPFRSSPGQGGARSKSRSPQPAAAAAAAPQQKRAPIPAATYRATMYNDEMQWELEYRGIKLGIRPNFTGLQLAQRLYQEDLAGNLGMGNAYSYRVMTGETGARKRQAGWQYPARQ